MKIIQILSEKIDDEIHDSAEYAKLALENKALYPGLAEVFYTLSLEEMKHMAMLHAEVTKLIDEYRRSKGEPPANMLAVYDYLHKKSIEKAQEAKNYQVLFKGV